MAERLTHLTRNPGEEIWISLQEVAGQQLVELRVYERASSATGGTPIPRAEGISIPLSLLPMLVKALSQAQATLVDRGLVVVPPAPKITQTMQGETSTFGAVGRPRTQPARQHPRVNLDLRGECRLLDTKEFWPSKPVACEIKDVSRGGAQVGLPKRLPRFVQVELSMIVNGMLFRGRAEVVAVEMQSNVDSTSSYFRHSLRWVGLEGPANAVLAKIVASRAEQQPGPAEDSPA
jgi:hypothetical protein